MLPFCNSPFWNQTLVGNVTIPQFTQCFRDSLLFYIPTGFLWIATLLYVPYLCNMKEKNHIRDVSCLGWMRVVVCLLNILVTLGDLILIEMLHTSGITQPVATHLKAVMHFATLVLASVLICVELRKGKQQTGVLFMFWLLSAVFGIPSFSHYVLFSKKLQTLPDYPLETGQLVLFYINYGCILLLLAFSAISDRPVRAPVDPELQSLLQGTESEVTVTDIELSINSQAERNSNCLVHKIEPNPEPTASFLSRISFWWISGLIVQGYRRTLNREDLYCVRPLDKNQNLTQKLQEAWHSQSDSSKKLKFKPRLDQDRTFSQSEEKRNKTKPTIIRALFKTFGSSFSLAGLYKVISDGLSFLSPLLLSELIGFVQSERPNWEGYCLAAVLFLNSFLQSMFSQQYFNDCYIVGMRARAAIMSLVFQKALNLSGSSRKSCTTGQIVNLVSVDAEKIYQMAGLFHIIWTLPLIMAATIASLWQYVGIAGLAGVGTMVLLLPFNAFIGNKQKQLQVEQMKKKDTRIKWINEILSGIKVIKLYAWELPFQSRITKTRKEEMDILKKYSYLNAGSSFTWMCAPYLVSLVTFAVYVSISDDNTLDAKKAFVALSLFNILRYPLSNLQSVISALVQVKVTCTRLNTFLNMEELNPGTISNHNILVSDIQGTSVALDKASFAWESSSSPLIKDLTLQVKRGELLAVVGEVGAGKTSFVSALLGEMYRIRGTSVVRGSIAYVPQQAWMQNATVKENVVFGKQYFNEMRYREIIESCALKLDIKMLPGGHETEIGEKGINLSGGQKQRIGIARAVYADADVYLLDDPLSAVDAHVGKHIFEKVIGKGGLLQYKTRVLVTHNISVLPKCDNIVVITDGRISEIGTYDELKRQDNQFAKFLKTHEKEANEEEEDEDEEELMEAEIEKSIKDLQESIRKSLEKKKESKIVKAEQSAEGKVKWSKVMTYARSFGGRSSLIILVAYIIYNATSIYSNIWLSQWSEDSKLNASSHDFENQRNLRLGVYGGLGLAQALSALAQSIAMAIGTVSACSTLHSILLSNILRAPMAFFETTPLGRILNRFSKDIDVVDVRIPATFNLFLIMVANVISTVIVVSYSLPIMLAVFAPLLIGYVIIQRFYIAASRQMMRIESVCRSPMYSTLEECVVGAVSIRAYKQKLRFDGVFNEKVNDHIAVFFANIAANRWLGVRLEFIGNCIVLAVSIFVIVFRHTLTGGLVGLAVSYALQITLALNYMVRTTNDMETNIIAVERINEYSNIKTEADFFNKDHTPGPTWPEMGKIEFHDYATRYRPGLDLVLKNVSCCTHGGEKIGIVGRTGAGKSSLAMALFRITEADSGNIIIDGEDVSRLGLHDLRSRLSIIPQDPVLFTGTLRVNLDPYEKHTDDEIWRALELARLQDYVRRQPHGLQFEVAEEGSNLSVGQKQQVCLARALLRNSKILVLDEATAAIDLTTDAVIQATIREQFKQCTIITIAHRINTIMDYDRVMVLDKGRIKEFDSPANLLQKKTSLFYNLAKEADLV